jgi:uncharacterized protein DUF4129
VPVRVADDLLTVLVVVYVLGFLVLVQVFLAIKGKWAPVKSHWVRNMLAVLLLTSIAAVVGHRLITHSGLARKVRQQQPEAPITGGDRTRAHAGGHAASSRTARFDWTLAAGLIGLLVVGGAIYLVRNRRVQPLDPDDVDVDAVAADLSAALSDAIDDLEREPNARRAVIAAYARMEGALARGGLGRRAAEAPFEYVARVLARLHVSAAAAHELTELFEQAKFSPRTVDAEMKERAIAAFVAVRDDLRVPVGA